MPMEEEGDKEMDILNDKDVVPSTQGGVDIPPPPQEKEKVTIPSTSLLLASAPRVLRTFVVSRVFSRRQYLEVVL